MRTVINELPLQEVRKKYYQILKENHEEILNSWMDALESNVPDIVAGLDIGVLRDQSQQFLDRFKLLLAKEIKMDFSAHEFEPIKNLLKETCTFYAKKGISPELTAGYVFSLKDTMIEILNKHYHDDPAWIYATLILNKNLLEPMGLYTYKVFVDAREDIIKQQAMAIAELSTPVIQLWDSVLALPLIGTVDSARAKQIMENLLSEIVKSKTSQVIIDITGVPVVDTGVADRLMRTVEAARLLGAECILTGISPAIAQTLVLVGIDLSGIQTRATLKNGLELALNNLNRQIVAKTAGQEK
jgi:rsbT co-antagonist protein RsbR